MTPKSGSSKKQVRKSEIDEEPETKNASDKSKSTDNKNVVKKENVKTEQESPQPKKPTPIHSFFTNKKESKSQSTSTTESGVEYNPGKSKYHPIDDAFWKHGEKYEFNDYCFLDVHSNNSIFFRVPYLALARTFEVIEDISSRLRMIEVLSNFFRSVIVLSPADLVACVFLCLNQLAPAYEGNLLIENYVLDNRV